ncbi:hypothetical protein [Streptomyces californicus]
MRAVSDLDGRTIEDPAPGRPPMLPTGRHRILAPAGVQSAEEAIR